MLPANTLYDLFTKQIAGKQTEWKTDPWYIFKDRTGVDQGNKTARYP